ncbi:hypothetical protein BGX38DRAFT_1196930 [Terfezia claveryi]|nr:hypothetical protein BGX38DRAFT_1243080 [Terfezia claveryi]KAF8445100.1 hypothetical protein BGX38DRAFT_1196930 [Terfezia claveryi]
MLSVQLSELDTLVCDVASREARIERSKHANMHYNSLPKPSQILQAPSQPIKGYTVIFH